MSALSGANLSFGYVQGQKVLRNANAMIPAGAFTALIGPNGAGKSTLLKLLLGLRVPWSGGVVIDDVPLATLHPRDRVRRLVYMPAHAESAFPFTVRQIVNMGAVAAGASASAVDEALHLVGLAHADDDPIGTLSAGERQRAALARALAQLSGRPRRGTTALLADEPIASMDPRHSMETLDALRSLARSGVAVAAVLHDLTAAARYCDRAIILNSEGRTVGEGPLQTVLSPPNLEGLFGVPFLSLRTPDGAPILTVAPGTRTDERPCKNSTSSSSLSS